MLNKFELITLCILISFVSTSFANVKYSNATTREAVSDGLFKDVKKFLKSHDINASKRKSEIFDQTFGKDYDREIRPVGENGTGPIVIVINLDLRNIENINDVEMEFVIQILFRQEWTDPRARYSHIQNDTEYLQLANPERIWKPDLYFENEKKSILHQLLEPNLLTRIYPDGGILQSYRITLRLSCPMVLHKYPLDYQKCPLRISTWGWSTDNLILKWKPNNPIQTNLANFKMPQFRATSYESSLCNYVTATGEYACLELLITFERNFGYYLIQIYLPCTMMVVVSWVTFFLEPTATEARVSLGVTTILAIVTQTYGINTRVPPTSYVKALDIWTTICQILIFGALFHFSLISYYTKYVNSNMPCKCNVKCLVNFREMEKEKARVHEELKKIGILKAKRLDQMARIVFPLAFLLFNTVYWSSYLCSL